MAVMAPSLAFHVLMIFFHETVAIIFFRMSPTSGAADPANAFEHEAPLVTVTEPSLSISRRTTFFVRFKKITLVPDSVHRWR